jgi:hypothetical protein
LAYRETPGVEVTAFCQRTKASAEKIAGLRHRQVFTDYQKCYQRPILMR